MRKGKRNNEKKPNNLRLLIVISACRGEMKDCRFFFYHVPELGNIKKRKIFEETTSDPTCSLKLAKISLPGVSVGL